MPSERQLAGSFPIPISVVVTTRHRPADVLPALASLLGQVRSLGGELVVISGASTDNEATAAPEGMRVHCMPGASIFDCRAAALTHASADIVALTEDHCIHPDGWCARVVENFRQSPDLILLGGAVANGSTRRLADRMNYWMTFAAFAPGQVTARHPCVAQLIVRASAIEQRLRPGELEGAVIETCKKMPGAVRVDPELCVRHIQSHGFWNTFAVHFHNGRATAGLSPRRADNRNLSIADSLRWSWADSKAHVRRSAGAFRAGTRSGLGALGYLLLILPLVVAHGLGEYVGYRKGAGTSVFHLG